VIVKAAIILIVGGFTTGEESEARDREAEVDE
jgi:hypothetical protein